MVFGDYQTLFIPAEDKVFLMFVSVAPLNVKTVINVIKPRKCYNFLPHM